jgi:hypothetical protein
MSRLIGQKFGTLTIIASRYERSTGHHPKHIVQVRCDCGRVYEKLRKGLDKARNPTCKDCYEATGVTARKEFGNRHPLYDTWAEMHRRCSDPRRPKYPAYGGRGIRVCDRWSDFETFVADMGRKPTRKHTLDRIDNDGPYSPENCRWATPEEQYRNSSNPAPAEVTLGGRTQSVYWWTKLLGIDYEKIRDAVARGRTHREAILNAIAAQERAEREP